MFGPPPMSKDNEEWMRRYWRNYLITIAICFGAAFIIVVLVVLYG